MHLPPLILIVARLFVTSPAPCEFRVAHPALPTDQRRQRFATEGHEARSFPFPFPSAFAPDETIAGIWNDLPRAGRSPAISALRLSRHSDSPGPDIPGPNRTRHRPHTEMRHLHRVLRIGRFWRSRFSITGLLVSVELLSDDGCLRVSSGAGGEIWKVIRSGPTSYFFVRLEQIPGPLPHQPLQVRIVFFELTLQTSKPEMGCHSGLDFLRLEWLGHVIRAALSKSPHLLSRFGQCADKNGRHVSEVLLSLQSAASREAVQPRHHDVQEDQVR